MIIRCPHCNALVSDKATICPKCGESLGAANAPLQNLTGVVNNLTTLAQMEAKVPGKGVWMGIYASPKDSEPYIRIAAEMADPDIGGNMSAFDKELLADINDGNYLWAVKKYKEAMGVGLVEAKAYVDDLRDRLKGESRSDAVERAMFSIKVPIVDLSALDYADSFYRRVTAGGAGLVSEIGDVQIAATVIAELAAKVFGKDLCSSQFELVGAAGDTYAFDFKGSPYRGGVHQNAPQPKPQQQPKPSGGFGGFDAALRAGNQSSQPSSPGLKKFTKFGK